MIEYSRMTATEGANLLPNPAVTVVEDCTSGEVTCDGGWDGELERKISQARRGEPAGR